MFPKIFVNLPVKDLVRSMEFFTALGFSFNAQFTDETAASMVVSEDIYVMLLTEARFQDFTPKKIVDARESTEVLVSFALESRQAVEELVAKASVVASDMHALAIAGLSQDEQASLARGLIHIRDNLQNSVTE